MSEALTECIVRKLSLDIVQHIFYPFDQYAPIVSYFSYQLARTTLARIERQEVVPRIRSQTERLSTKAASPHSLRTQPRVTERLIAILKLSLVRTSSRVSAPRDLKHAAHHTSWHKDLDPRNLIVQPQTLTTFPWLNIYFLRGFRKDDANTPTAHCGHVHGDAFRTSCAIGDNLRSARATAKDHPG